MVADRSPRVLSSTAGNGNRLRGAFQLLGVNVSDPGVNSGGAGIAARHRDGHVPRGLAVQPHRVSGRASCFGNPRRGGRYRHGGVVVGYRYPALPPTDYRSCGPSEESLITTRAIADGRIILDR